MSLRAWLEDYYEDYTPADVFADLYRATTRASLAAILLGILAYASVIATAVVPAGTGPDAEFDRILIVAGTVYLMTTFYYPMRGLVGCVVNIYTDHIRGDEEVAV